MKYSASLLAAAGLVAAQSSADVVSVFLPAFQAETVVASVISVDPTATSYLVNCPSSIKSEDCGLGEGIKVLYGPSTMTYGMTLADSATYTANCKLNPAENTAACDGAVISDGSTSTGVEVLVGYSTFIVPVTVTAGAEKLGAAPAATTGPAASNPTTLATTAAPTNSQQGTGAGAGQNAAATSSTSTGGMPRVTQNAVVMGAAALVGGAMFL